jgi:hypothetical protein
MSQKKESIKAVAKGTGRDGARLMPFVDSISSERDKADYFPRLASRDCPTGNGCEGRGLRKV